MAPAGTGSRSHQKPAGQAWQMRTSHSSPGRAAPGGIGHPPVPSVPAINPAHGTCHVMAGGQWAHPIGRCC